MEEDGSVYTDDLTQILKNKLIEHGEGQSSYSKVRARIAAAKFENSKLMCPQLNAFDLTLKLQEIDNSESLKTAVMDVSRARVLT